MAGRWALKRLQEGLLDSAELKAVAQTLLPPGEASCALMLHEPYFPVTSGHGQHGFALKTKQNDHKKPTT